MTKLKILSIGSDRKLFEEGSAVRARAAAYGSLFGEIHIVVFALKSAGLKEGKAADNVWLHPTSSRSRWLYVFDAARIGMRIAKERGMGRSDSVITAQDPFESGLVGLRLKRATGIALQLQLHTDLGSAEFWKSPLNAVRAAIARRTLKRADEIRVVSERAKRGLMSRGIPEERIDVLPIFVEPGRFAAPHGDDIHSRFPRFSDVLFMASRLEPEKDVPLAIEALKAIVAKRPKAGLVIAGEGRQKAALEALAKRLGVESSVAFEPWQSELASMYATADAFLLTSKFEGYGMSLVEAGLSGAAIVTTDVGIAGDILKDGDNAFVCPVGDAACIANKTLELLENRAVRDRFKAKAAADMRRAIITDTQAYLDRYRDLIEKAQIQSNQWQKQAKP